MFARRHFFAIGDLEREELVAILDRSEVLRRLLPATNQLPRGTLVGLFFFQSSTRTRLGFRAAVARLGSTSIELDAMRTDSGMSEEEAPFDAFRSVAGYCDLIVLRHRNEEVFRQMLEVSPVPVINGGCGTRHHPTQSLIDLFFIRSRLGRLEDLRIGIAGDLAGSRAARSLVEALRFFRVRELRLMAPADRQLEPATLGGNLDEVARHLDNLDVRDLDILYMAGFPPGIGVNRANQSLRFRFRLTRELALQLPTSAPILCPLPRIDEIAADVDNLPQAAYFDQSQLGLFVRTAVLEHFVSPGS